MADKWKSLKHKWTLEEAQKLGTLSIAKMPLSEKAELAQFYYRQFGLRANSFVKAMTIPYAFHKIYIDFDKIAKSPNVSDDRRNLSLEAPIVVRKGKYRTLAEPFANMDNPSAALNYYITRMQSFFSSKSSTVKGWKEVAERQDMELFGVNANQYRKYTYVIDENGKRRRKELLGAFFHVTPKYRLTDSERVKFWSIVDLAKDAGWLNRFGYSSAQTHRQIASLWMSGFLDHDDINSAYDEILKIIESKDNLRHKYPDIIKGEPGSPFGQSDGKGEIDNGKSERSDLLSQYDTLQ